MEVWFCTFLPLWIIVINHGRSLVQFWFQEVALVYSEYQRKRLRGSGDEFICPVYSPATLAPFLRDWQLQNGSYLQTQKNRNNVWTILLHKEGEGTHYLTMILSPNPSKPVWRKSVIAFSSIDFRTARTKNYTLSSGNWGEAGILKKGKGK